MLHNVAVLVYLPPCYPRRSRRAHKCDAEMDHLPHLACPRPEVYNTYSHNIGLVTVRDMISNSQYIFEPINTCNRGGASTNSS